MSAIEMLAMLHLVFLTWRLVVIAGLAFLYTPVKSFQPMTQNRTGHRADSMLQESLHTIITGIQIIPSGGSKIICYQVMLSFTYTPSRINNCKELTTTRNNHSFHEFCVFSSQLINYSYLQNIFKIYHQATQSITYLGIIFKRGRKKNLAGCTWQWYMYFVYIVSSMAKDFPNIMT